MDRALPHRWQPRPPRHRRYSGIELSLHHASYCRFGVHWVRFARVLTHARTRSDRYPQQGNRDMRRLILLVLGSFCTLWGQAGPYVRQEVDNAAAARGKRLYTQFCINCHGALAKGTEQGPDLIRSPLVLRDRLGDQVGPALKKLPNHKSDLTQAQVGDLTHFLKDQVEATAKNRNPVTPPNVLTGNAEAGRAYFAGAGKCNTCHSATGDLAGVGRKYNP